MCGLTPIRTGSTSNSVSLSEPAATNLFELQHDRRVPPKLIQVSARILDNGMVRCGNGVGCKGRLGQILGVWLNPGPGWQYLGGDPISLDDRGEIYFGEFGLVNGTWLPRRNACRRWHLVLGHVDPDGLSLRRTGRPCTPRLQHGGVLARQQASRPSASPAFRQLVGKGLATFGRNQVARGWDWDPIDEEVIAPPGCYVAEAAALPLNVVCYVCFAVNRVAR
jgi:hypothetical protein